MTIGGYDWDSDHYLVREKLNVKLNSWQEEKKRQSTDII